MVLMLMYIHLHMFILSAFNPGNRLSAPCIQKKGVHRIKTCSSQTNQTQSQTSTLFETAVNIDQDSELQTPCRDLLTATTEGWHFRILAFGCPEKRAVLAR